MTSDTQKPWSRIIAVFDEMCALPDAERRRQLELLATAEPAVHAEVASLLQALDHTSLDHSPVAGAALPAPSSPLGAGARLGPWVIIRRIGEGGMGTVYEAARGDAAYEGRVAIKTLAARAVTPSATRRFVQERQILASLQHPHIAALLDGGTTDDGLPYLVMEYVDGAPIDQWCDARQLNIGARLDLFRQVCDALQYAHRNLVVHRDLKPSNILVTSDGRVKVVDFGIAKLLDETTESGAPTDTRVPLTLAYASPEQVRGATITTASDVYSLGVVLHHLLAGSTPYTVDATTPLQLMAAITEGVPVPPSQTASDARALARGLPHARSLRDALARELDAIVLMALRKEPDRRYAGADALGDDILRFLRGLPVIARADTLGYRTRKFVRRQRALVAGVSVAFAAVTLGAVASLRQAQRATAEAARSERFAGFLQTVLGSSDAFLEGTAISLGPTASVAELLDSAATRVPREFADDPRIRARLYGTIGSAFLSRSRMAEATFLLDSAATLANATYGPASPQRVTALLDGAESLLHRNRFREAEQRVQTALAALESSGQRGTPLHVRAQLELASQAYVQADLRRVDSLVRLALSADSALDRAPTIVRASLLNRLGSIQALTVGVTESEKTLRHALKTHESARASFTVEQADILNNLASSIMAQGRWAEADSICQRGAASTIRTFGPASREAAIFDVCTGSFALMRGDTAVARQRIMRALRIADSVPEVFLTHRLRPREALIGLESAVGRWAAADSIAAELHQLARGSNWTSRLNADMAYARTRGSLGNFATAESLFRDAARLQDSTGIRVPNVDPWIRVSLAQILAVTDRQAASDSLTRTMSPAEQKLVSDFVAIRRARAARPPR
ncbi:MAG: protein kinase [Gemmatimonadetes bacterium]|nr:protein kinase [Gemmatimonadota bacterium]